MSNLNKFLCSALASVGFVLSAIPVFAQTANTTQATPAPSSGFVLDVNSVLAILVIILFLVLAVLASTLKHSMTLYKKRIKNEKKTTSGGAAKVVAMLVGILFLSAFAVNAQTATTAAADTTQSSGNLLRYLLLFIIALELVAIFVVIRWFNFFTGIEELDRVGSGSSFSNFWNRFNKFKNIKDESEIDMGHEYDGIRELNNVLPPWYTWTFFGTIVFAVIYLWRFVFAAVPAPDQYQELDIAIKKAQQAQEAYIAANGGGVDENTVVMLDAAGIEAGGKLFQANCVVCHTADAGGLIGPNLTDNYWIHGGTINNVFATIKNGVIDKGMQSWKNVFSATQIAELASYVRSIHGTKPANPKEPQGVLTNDDGTPITTAAATDSTATAAK
jgi:cytochrome c oxidase cbb3-type subunit 3